MLWPLLFHGIRADLSGTSINALATRIHGDSGVATDRRPYQPRIRPGAQAWDTAVRSLGCPISGRCFNRWDFSQSRLGIDAKEHKIEF